MDDVPSALSYLADPDAALLTLLRLAESARDAGELPALAALGQTRAGAKLAVLLGASSALGDFLVRHPELLADFPEWDGRDPFTDLDPRRELLAAVGADPAAEAPVAALSGPAAVDAMRVAYRGRIATLASCYRCRNDSCGCAAGNLPAQQLPQSG